MVLLGLGAILFAAAGTIHRASGLTMDTTWAAQWVVLPWRDAGQAGSPVAPIDSPLAERSRSRDAHGQAVITQIATALPYGTPTTVEAELDVLFAFLDRGVFSTYAAESELSNLNRQPVGIPLAVSGELFDVLLLAREISALSRGAFDPTVGELVQAWGFGPGHPRVPAPEEVLAAREAVGMAALELDEEAKTATRRGDVRLDLNAVAKGYAADRAGALLAAKGARNYFIEVGGELKVAGRKPGFRAWRAALEAPAVGTSVVYRVIGNRGETLGIAGSGDYRNFFESGGERYSHLIDPATGSPVRDQLAAAYVIDPSAARADALATALMIMGLEEARALAADNNLPALLIHSEDSGAWTHHASAEFSRYWLP